MAVEICFVGDDWTKHWHEKRNDFSVTWDFGTHLTGNGMAYRLMAAINPGAATTTGDPQ